MRIDLVEHDCLGIPVHNGDDYLDSIPYPGIIGGGVVVAHPDKQSLTGDHVHGGMILSRIFFE